MSPADLVSSSLTLKYFIDSGSFTTVEWDIDGNKADNGCVQKLRGWLYVGVRGDTNMAAAHWWAQVPVACVRGMSVMVQMLRALMYV